jgi:hypothetical protein
LDVEKNIRLTVFFLSADSIFGTDLEYYLSNNDKIMIDPKVENEGEEKEWENPLDPEKTTDERDKEQLARQYKEAKRRHDNLSENQDNEENETKKLT